MTISVLAIGSYPHPVEESLKRALRESIRAHMQAYGVRVSRLQSGDTSELFAALAALESPEGGRDGE